MIGSLKEKAKNMPRIKVSPEELFVYEIVKEGHTIAELIICAIEMSYDLGSGKSEVKLQCFNLNGTEIKLTEQPIL
ncbi:MAG: hypothetical protein V4687_16210 [Bacteroidota bacterium]